MGYDLPDAGGLLLRGAAVLAIVDLPRSVFATQGLVRHYRHWKAESRLHAAADDSAQNLSQLRAPKAPVEKGPLVRRLKRRGRQKFFQSPRVGDDARTAARKEKPLFRKEKRRAISFETSSIGGSHLLESVDAKLVATANTGHAPSLKDMPVGINSMEVSPSGLVEMVRPSRLVVKDAMYRAQLDSQQLPLTTVMPTAMPAGVPATQPTATGSPAAVPPVSTGTAMPLPGVSSDHPAATGAAPAPAPAPAPAAAASGHTDVTKMVFAMVFLIVIMTTVALVVLWRNYRSKQESTNDDGASFAHRQSYRDRRKSKDSSSRRKSRDVGATFSAASSMNSLKLQDAAETTDESERSGDDVVKATHSAQVLAANEALRRDQEKNEKRASQESVNGGKSGKKAKVNWNAIDGACAEILRIESRADTSVVLSTFSDNEGGFEAPEKSVEVDGFLGGRALKDGLVWKLNSDADPTSEDSMGQLSSWRRRRFVMQRCEGKLGLLYISEKENGTMVLGAILQDTKNGHAASVRELPPVRLAPLDSAALYKLSRNLHQYDLGFAFEKFRTDEEYEKEVPHSMQPITISWVDAAEKPQRLVIGMPLYKERAAWLKTMRDSMGIDD